MDANSINYYGYIKAISGLGKVCRDYISLFRQLKKNVTAINIPCGLPETDFFTQDKINPEAAISIVHMNADSMVYFFNVIDKFNLKNTFNIGFWVWEFKAFNSEWYKSFEFLDEIWVPSEFAKEAIQSISPIPVYTVPHLVNLKLNQSIKINPRKLLNLPEDFFLFGYMFDCSSSILRKNPFYLVEAFNKEFKNIKKVGLVLKLSHAEKDPELYKTFKKYISNLPNIFIIEKILSEDQINIFYLAIDCYVSPHRSEGFGLTIAEAMASGKPVIATDYGGSKDFVKPQHSFPLKYSLINVSENYGPYKTSYLWADPDIIHLRTLLYKVYSKKSDAQKIGSKAKCFIENNYSSEKIKHTIEQRISKILN